MTMAELLPTGFSTELPTRGGLDGMNYLRNDRDVPDFPD